MLIGFPPRSAAFFASDGTEIKDFPYEVYIGPFFFVPINQRDKATLYYTDYFQAGKTNNYGLWDFAQEPPENIPCMPGLFGPGFLYFDPLAVESKTLERVAKVVLTVLPKGVLRKRFQ